ncbi:MAG: arylsulfatase [Acidobacteria bacterium]|nr:arylsulfatase [Acidobacteriota bacterium]
MIGISRRQWLAALAAAPVPAQSRRRPNIVVMLADDQGWGDLGINGNTNLATPHIDSIARDGALFDRFFVCPVCAPTRAEFLTGRYHGRGGVRGVSTGEERLNTDEHTIAQTFKSAGYATGAFGKWHNGSQHPYHPNARGFDEFYGFTEGHWGQYFNPELEHNGEIVRARGFIADIITDRALRFIGQHHTRPFFCYLPFNTPHSPYQVPGRYFDKFAALDPPLKARDPQQESLPITRSVLAMMENLDANVGRVLAHLQSLNLANDTIVVYFSDNGPQSWRWNGGMKGRKGNLDEGGIRSPLLIRWPGHIAQGTRIPQIAAAIDLLPTLAALAGIPIRAEKPLDGRNLQPLLANPAAPWQDRMIFTAWRNRVSVRTQQYRLDPDGRLFDLPADPGQDRDIAAAQPAIATRLKAAAAEFARTVLPPLADPRPYPVGYSRTTRLPARDGVPHGGVRRSAPAPNCSYFTNWTRPGDSITFDIEVARPGRFHAEIYYACPAADTGSTIELAFGDARLTARITEPHNPPALGASDDRAPRGGESLVKDFRPMTLGPIFLAQHRGPLTLRATEIKGAQVAEIRYLALTRLD